MTCALDGCDREAGSPVLIKCDGEDPDLQVGVFKIAPCFFNGFSTVSTATFNQVVFDFILEQATLAGETLTTFDSLDGYCVDDPVQSEANPTPFPTFDAATKWTCDPSNFGRRDGCHCNCGAPDPDCALDKFTVFNCGGGEVCNDNGLCVAEAAANGENEGDEVNNDNIILIIGLVVLGVAVVALFAYILIKKKTDQPAAENKDLEKI